MKAIQLFTVALWASTLNKGIEGVGYGGKGIENVSYGLRDKAKCDILVFNKSVLTGTENVGKFISDKSKETVKENKDWEKEKWQDAWNCYRDEEYKNLNDEILYKDKDNEDDFVEIHTPKSKLTDALKRMEKEEKKAKEKERAERWEKWKNNYSFRLFK